MKGEIEKHAIYEANTDEYSDQMESPFRLLHVSKVGWVENKYSGYAILVKKDDKVQVLVKLTGNRSEKLKIVGLLSSLEKLVRIEHSIATGRGFKYKDLMSEDQLISYKDESERIRNQFTEIGVDLP